MGTLGWWESARLAWLHRRAHRLADRRVVQNGDWLGESTARAVVVHWAWMIQQGERGCC